MNIGSTLGEKLILPACLWTLPQRISLCVSVCEMCVCGGLLLGGGWGARRVGGIFAYHQSRERGFNEERMCVYVCVGCICVLGVVLMG